MRIRFRRLFFIGLAVAVRVLWLTRFAPDPIAPVDAEGYHLLAVNVLAGRGFAIGWDPPFCPTAVRTPLYPLFLMGGYLLGGVDPRAIVWLHVLLEALTTACVMRLADAVVQWGIGQETSPNPREGETSPNNGEARTSSVKGRWVGTLAGGLYAFNGSTQRYVGFLFAEMLLLPLMTLALWATVRMLGARLDNKGAVGRYAGAYPMFSSVAPIVAAVGWGLACLTKPNIQFLVLGIGLLLLLDSICDLDSMFGISGRHRALNHTTRDVKVLILNYKFSILIFWGTLGLVLCPWLIRNRLLLERWVLSTAFEENLARVSAVATLAEVQGVRVEPWTESWEYLYRQIVATAASRYNWGASQARWISCVQQNQQRRQVVAVARDLVKRYPRAFLVTHLRGVGLSLLDPGHRLWYKVLTGQAWEATGVIENIWARMAWSLKRRAVGDALQAFWQERVTRPPLGAALLWWALGLARIGVGWLSARGLWALRHKPLMLLVLAGAVMYTLILAGPIAHDRFYLPAIPVVVTLVALGVRST